MRPALRTISFFTTWVAELMRQPVLLATLLLGPFVILVGFGSSVDVSDIKPEVILVRSESEDPLQPLPEEIDEHVEVVGETTDLTWAVRQVQDGKVDAVAVIPPDPGETLSRGERIPLQVFTSEIDPLTDRFTEAYLADQVAELNRKALEEAILEAQSSVEDVEGYVASARGYVGVARAASGDVETVQAQLTRVRELLGPLEEATQAVVDATAGVSFVIPGFGRPTEQLADFEASVNELVTAVDALDAQLGTVSPGSAAETDAELDEIEATLDRVETSARELQSIPAEVLAAPFELELENVAPFRPNFTGFYSPAVLALLLQHLGISLAALSLTRIRVLGLMSMLRIAPIRPFEIVNGQYLSYGMVITATGAAILAAMHWGLEVPIFGPLAYVAAAFVLLVAVSLGLGFALSLVTTSEQQASQLAMLVLLASVFFSGLVVTLERLTWPVRALSFALPSTYATRAAQDLMLRGVLRHPEDLVVLAGAAVLLYVLTIMLLSERLRPS
jgi:ABC-2 type transport system permease protein